jgi:hypothetical protein
MWDDLDGYDIAQQIRQERQGFEGSFLILEGGRDAAGIEKFIEENECSIVIAGGKDNAVCAIDLLDDEGFGGVLCIVDIDYQPASGAVVRGGNLIETPVRDFDVLIFSTTALDNYLKERADKNRLTEFEKATSSDIRNYILEVARPIGCLRSLSYRKDYGLNFKRMTFNFVIEDSLTINVNMLFSEVIGMSRVETSPAVIRSQFDTVLKTHTDPLKVCNGHDVCKILGIALRKCIGDLRDSRAWGSEIELGLRLAFGLQQFWETDVFQKICNWQVTNAPYIILKSECYRSA